MENKPLLSICIPTYNRADYLDKSLESLTSLPEFTMGQVECVISDNASTDNTKDVVRKYTSKFDNVFYFKNAENIKDQNFPIVLGRANGVFRKLQNDTIVYEHHFLSRMISIINDNKQEKPVLFFMNNGYKDFCKTKNLEKFLYKVSFFTTWIGGFGVWDNDAVRIENNSYGCDKHLWQVPFLLDMVSKKNNSLIISEKLFCTQTVKNKDLSYGLYEVFYKNYLSFVSDCLQKKQISLDCYNWLEKDLGFNFFITWLANYTLQNKKANYSKSEDLVKLVCKEYKNKSYYFSFIIKLQIVKLKLKIKKILG